MPPTSLADLAVAASPAVVVGVDDEPHAAKVAASPITSAVAPILYLMLHSCLGRS
jgi:hypothetical protein